MKRKLSHLIIKYGILFLLIAIPRVAWCGSLNDTIAECQCDSDSLPKINLMLHPSDEVQLPYEQSMKKHWLKALGENVGLNLFFHIATRYIANEDYAKISYKSIVRNFNTGFLWDNDNFKTNLFSHPYQGGLYYNSARSNGLNFWESAPYALFGSYVWEMFMETQPPSTNDILATTLGGIGIGEVTYRLSSVILRGNARGFERVLREACGAIIDPIRGLNRIVSGDAWKMGKKYVGKEGAVPIHIGVDVGMRTLQDRINLVSQTKYMGAFTFTFSYNDPFEINGKVPFQYFKGRLGFNAGGGQPNLFLAKFRASIWGVPYVHKFRKLFFGIFQNYYFYNSESLNDNKKDVPYRIGETVSYGPGIIMLIPFQPQIHYLNVCGFVSGIILGGALSDNYYFQDRDYNLGSGYSFKSEVQYNFKRINLLAGFENYHIFTWKGYVNKNYANIDPSYLDAQGAEGNARLTVVKLKASLNVYRNFGISIEANWLWRISHYKYFNTVHTKALETLFTATYSI